MNQLSSKQGWTTKQVYDIIVRESGGTRYHYTYIYTVLTHKWGFKQKVPRKVHVNTASKEEKERFKKEPERYWILSKKKISQQYLLDESFFFYDSLVRRVWIRKDERPVVKITGSPSRISFVWCYKFRRKTTISDSMIGLTKTHFQTI